MTHDDEMAAAEINQLIEGRSGINLEVCGLQDEQEFEAASAWAELAWEYWCTTEADVEDAVDATEGPQ